MDKQLALARLQRKREREQREYEIQKMVLDRVVLNPNVIRVALAAAIIGYTTYATTSKHNVGPVQTALAIAGPTIGIPLIAADAGVRDRWALAAIAGMGAAATTGLAVKGWADAGVLDQVPGLNVLDWFSDQLAAVTANIPVLGSVLTD